MASLDAFVLSVTDVAEYDRRYSLLTAEYGKISAVVKSVRKPRAKLAGHLDIPNGSWIELVPTSKGWQVTQALEQHSFPCLRAEYDALRIVLRVARSLDAFLAEGQDKELFGAWGQFLHKMESYAQRHGQDVSFDFLGAQFMLRALSTFGFLPDLRVCSICEKPFGPAAAFVLNHQVWCTSCARAKHIRGTRIDSRALALCRQILGGVWFASSVHAGDIIELTRHFERQSRQYMV